MLLCNETFEFLIHILVSQFKYRISREIRKTKNRCSAIYTDFSYFQKDARLIKNSNHKLVTNHEQMSKLNSLVKIYILEQLLAEIHKLLNKMSFFLKSIVLPLVSIPILFFPASKPQPRCAFNWTSVRSQSGPSPTSNECSSRSRGLCSL